MTPLRRHQLAYLSAAAWTEVLGRPWDALAHDCLRHWSERRLPLVVTRQPEGARPGGPVALGLPAPLAWERRRIALQVPREAIAWLDEFPRAAELLRLLPTRARAVTSELIDRLASLAVRPRTYGSYGWQQLTGHRYVGPESDLDLWMAVEDAAQADAVTSCLLSTALQRPRLDGELVFLDGGAVAWREWAAWRAGRTRHLLVKRLSGPTLTQSLEPAGAHEAVAT